MPLTNDAAEQAARLHAARTAGEDLADFQFATSAMEIGTWKGGPVVNMIGSSTIRDMKGDIVLESALTSMASKAGPGLLIWLNHDYTVPDSVFGALIKAPNISVTDGIADLHISSDVEMDNKKAADTYKMITKGRRFGCSVGMRVDDAEIDEEHYEKTGELALLIKEVTPVEWSVVGVPCNQRSFVEMAALGVYTKSLRRGRTDFALRMAPIIKGLFPRDYRDITHAVAASNPEMANKLASVEEQKPRARPIYWDPITRDFGELVRKTTEGGAPASAPEFVSLSRDQVVQRLHMLQTPTTKAMHQAADGGLPDDYEDPEAEARVAAAGADPFDAALVLVDPAQPGTGQVLVSAPADVIAGEEHPEGERNSVFLLPPGWTALAETTARAAPKGHVLLNGWTISTTTPPPTLPITSSVPPVLTPTEPPVTKDTTKTPSPYRAWKQAGIVALTAATLTTKDASAVELADDGVSHDPCFGFHTHHGYTHYHINDAAHDDTRRAPESDAARRARKDAARSARLTLKATQRDAQADQRAALIAHLMPPAPVAEGETPASADAPLTELDPKLARKAAMLKDLAEELGIAIKGDKPLRLPRPDTRRDAQFAALRLVLREAADGIVVTKSGASVSQENLARLQLAHDALNLVTDGGLCQKGGDAGLQSLAPIQVLNGVTPELIAAQLTNYEALATSLEGVAGEMAKLDVAALSAEVKSAQTALLKDLTQAKADLVTLKANVDAVRNMSLGRPTQAGATVVIPGTTATWLDMAQSGAGGADPAAPGAPVRPADAVTDSKYPGTYIHLLKRSLSGGRSFEQRCRHWPAEIGERPELSASQMVSMTTAEIYAYKNGQEADVPERD